MDILYVIWDSFFTKIIAALVAPALLAAIYHGTKHLYRAFKALRYAKAALGAVDCIYENGLRREGPGFWLKKPIVRPTNYNDLQGSSIPILMIGATKGGVGKTSLAGSLAAHFSMRWVQRRQVSATEKPLRVLVIDQDFQGSFSTMTVDVNTRYVQPSKSNRLVSGELADGRLVEVAEPISQSGMQQNLTIRTIPAYYDLAQAENRVLIEWLLPLSDTGLISRLLRILRIRESTRANTHKDIRYLLSEALLHPRVQTDFDLVIIDSPPRLTTSHIQAMCAATHLIIPTILDGLAGDAVARYLDQVAIHKLGSPGDTSRAICPHLTPIGVVCTMLPPGPANLDGKINVLAGRIAAASLPVDIVPQECFIRQRPPYRQHAGERIAYAASPNDVAHNILREEVDRLGDWIAPKIGSVARGWRRL